MAEGPVSRTDRFSTLRSWDLLARPMKSGGRCRATAARVAPDDEVGWTRACRSRHTNDMAWDKRKKAERSTREEAEAAFASGESLEGVILNGVDLRGIDLRGANLRGADLQNAWLWNADLRGADLTGARLGGAALHGADLRDSKLRDSRLIGCDLTKAKLGGADLTGAEWGFLHKALGDARTVWPEGFAPVARNPSHRKQAAKRTSRPKRTSRRRR